jgi:hypothetical protein
MSTMGSDTTTGSWIKSSRCGPHGGDCVEFKRNPSGVHVRDSKRGSGALIALSHGAWSPFVEHYRRS